MEHPIPLSQLDIWQHQRQFYVQNGIASWQGVVPFYATSNAYIACTYVSLIVAFIQDRHQQGIFEPITIVELGAGCGQLSYLILHQLMHHTTISNSDWHYVMTDAAFSVVEFWQTHPGFKAYITNNQLSVMAWEIGKPCPPYITQTAQSDALIVIANYIFDSLPADIYHIQDEVLSPIYVAAGVAHKQCSVDFSEIALSFHVQPSIETNDPVLSFYRQTLLNSTILYPQSSIELLAELKAVAQHGCLVITSDKAYVDIDELDYLGDPELTPHAGCFSLMVNFDALKRWCVAQGGFASMPSRRSGLKTGLLAFNLVTDDYPGLASTARRLIEGVSPGQYLDIYRHVQHQVDTLSLEACTSYLAFSQWDPTLFLQCYRRITELLDGADLLTVNYLLNHLEVIANQVYWMPDQDDCWFLLGVLCHQLKRYPDAIKYYQQSLLYYPAVFGMYFNLGICQANCHLTQDAVQSFKKALALEPTDARTQDWLQRLV